MEYVGNERNVGVVLLEGGVCKVMYGNNYPYPRAFAIQSLQSRYGAPPLEASRQTLKQAMLWSCHL